MSIKVYSYYTKRDLLYKVPRNNIYSNIHITDYIVYNNLSGNGKVYTALSSFILLFDKLAYLSRIKKTKDKKLINSFVKSYINLTYTEFINFLLRLNLINFPVLFDVKKITNTNYTFKLNSNVFEEFIFFYKKYFNFFYIYFSFSFVNCKNIEEKQLLLTTLNNII